jgi:hypothetical protein
LTQEDTTYGGPFGRAAQTYRSAGWRGVLPIGRQPGRKYPPPAAFTGHGKPDPSGADSQSWLDGPEAAFNVGLRLPPGVLGLDVDAYAGKRGGESLAALVAQHGPLPPTWITTARTDGVSGIRLFRVPTSINGREINWPGEAGRHIELIQHGHRYAVVWPSVNPEAAGAEYRWEWQGFGAEGVIVPEPDAIPYLPEAWVRGLILPYTRVDKTSLGDAAAAAWWDGLR